jgi:hypothetical protein
MTKLFVGVGTFSGKPCIEDIVRFKRNPRTLGRTMESVLSKLKPEAAYFAPLEGKRGGMIFFDLADPSQIVESVEPFFLGLNATTELVPVMNADDLRKGLAKVAGK